MSDELRKRAEKVVEGFKESLDTEVREKISNPAYSTLTLMIVEALSEQRLETADRLEALVKALRLETNKSELGL